MNINNYWDLLMQQIPFYHSEVHFCELVTISRFHTYGWVVLCFKLDCICLWLITHHICDSSPLYMSVIDCAPYMSVINHPPYISVINHPLHMSMIHLPCTCLWLIMHHTCLWLIIHHICLWLITHCTCLWFITPVHVCDWSPSKLVCD